MDIGPVRRRFTAEPVSPAVPGEEPTLHEPTARERAGTGDRTAEGARPAPDPVPATRA